MLERLVAWLVRVRLRLRYHDRRLQAIANRARREIRRRDAAMPDDYGPVRTAFGQSVNLTDAVLTIVIAGVVGYVGLQVGSDTEDSANFDTNRYENVNETFQNPSAGEVIQLNASRIDAATYDAQSAITVYDENDTQLSQSGNYTWNENNGTLRVESGGDLAGDANGSITYGYEFDSSFQNGSDAVTSGFETSFGLLDVVFIAIMLSVIVAALVGLRSR